MFLYIVLHLNPRKKICMVSEVQVCELVEGLLCIVFITTKSNKIQTSSK